LAINKQLIIQPKVAKNHLVKFVKNLEDEGIRIVFTDPKSLGKTKIQTIFPSQNANYVILDKLTTKKLKGKKIGSDQDAVGEWAVAKKIESAGTNSSQDLVKKDLLMD